MFRILFVSLLFLVQCRPPQSTGGTPVAGELFNEQEATRIERILAADDMRGRKTFSPEIDRAADFIAGEFRAAGLSTWKGSGTYLQSFAMMRARLLEQSGVADGRSLTRDELFVFTSQPVLKVSSQSGYEQRSISAGENLFAQARNLARLDKNLVVQVDAAHAASFSNLSRLKGNYFKSPYNMVFILGDRLPAHWEAEARHEFTEQPLANVVAVWPGKSRAGEYVIFSAHYDHIGVGKPVNGDSIYNGANDDASGVTATILLARHFARLGPQERTLIFVAFTAEEVGGFGSQYFSRQLDPASIVAMFNIEMIGTPSKWGTNSAFITGYERSDLGSIMQRNLEGSAFEFHPDPYPQQQLFFRSDNATLARLGVPAHTISTAKMENEPHYHQVSDEVGTLDMANMTRIIEAIALSARSVLEGKDTPTRVVTTNL